ncbi:hypothetical protein J3F84DRAFT_366188, partial [Trichoderma pleuroticola]
MASSARALLPTAGFLLVSNSSSTGCQSTSKNSESHCLAAARNYRVIDEMLRSTVSFHELETGQTFEIDVFSEDGRI